MRLLLAFALALCASVAVADDLDDAHKSCVAHTHPVSPPFSTAKPFDAGWEHCGVITPAWQKRENEAAELDEVRNPDLKKGRDLAKKLMANPAPNEPGK